MTATMRIGIKASAALCGLLVALAATARADEVHRAGRWMVDTDGRVFVGHGFNVMKKLAPFVRSEFTDADARLLADNGFTVARIGFIWAGVEPQPGKYDDAYIAKVIALNALLAKYGIHTVVDFHQDAWSQYATMLAGDGAPRWATPEPSALDDFQDFWDDAPAPDGVGLQTHFINAWRHVVSVFRRDKSFGNVMAWDPFNEPYAGTRTGCAPFTPCPLFETGALADFYRRVIPAIRAAGGTQVIQPEAIADSGVVAPSLPGFDDPQVAYQYHFYCNVTQTSSRQTAVGDGSPESRLCQPIEANAFANYHSYLAKLGVPGFLGEFSCNDVDDDNAQVVDIADAAFDSWTAWAYYTAADDPADCPNQGLLVDDSRPGVAKQPKLDAFAVPYAQAIAGTPQSTSLDRASKTYKLTYTATAVPGAELRSHVTQIFVPQRMYPKGYAAAVTGGEVVSAPGASSLLVRASGGRVSVTVTPRAAASEPRTFETVMQHSQAGEPVIAVDPRVPGMLLEEDSAGIKVSRDYGHTWSVVASGQVDPAVAVDPGGRFIAHSSSGGYVPLDGFWITTSTDQGATWSDPVQTFQYPQLEKGTVIAWDRPWLGVDSTTGTIYASIAAHTEQPGSDLSDAATLAAYAGCHATVFTNVLLPCGRRYVSASHDHGRSFGPMHAIDSADYPNTVTGGFSGIPVAAHGVLATGYYAAAAPGRRCPCLVFETSSDDGASWTRHVVAGASPVVHNGPATVLDDDPSRAPYVSPVISDSPSVELGPFAAADPVHAGSFALMMQDASRTRLLVYRTADGGAHWSAPAVLESGPGDTVDRPWLAYTTSGALTAFWRSDHSAEGDPFDAYVSVAPSGGSGFGPPQRLSAAPSPGSGNFQDDASYVAGDDHFVYGVWGDLRADGQLEPWIGGYRYR